MRVQLIFIELQPKDQVGTALGASLFQVFCVVDPRVCRVLLTRDQLVLVVRKA